VPGPDVIVGASLGGLNAQRFAKQAPGEVAGLVLVDAIPPDFDRRFAEVMGIAEDEPDVVVQAVRDVVAEAGG
jgi:pimeloyl-ACP methyl ester carboxylesterase